MSENPVQLAANSQWWLVLLVIVLPALVAIGGKLLQERYSRREKPPAAADAIDKAFAAMAAEQTRRLRTLERQLGAERKQVDDLRGRLSELERKYALLQASNQQTLHEKEQLTEDIRNLTRELNRIGHRRGDN